MKARRIGLALAMLATLALAAGSEVVRVRAQPRPVPPPTAERKLIRHLVLQVCSDVSTKRAIDPKDVQQLMAYARRDDEAGIEGLSGLITLRFTTYHDEVVELALHKARREKAGGAYNAIGLLECWRDTRWRALAEAHTDEPGEWGEMFRQMLATSE